MNTYQPSTPRAVFATIAIALTVITLSVAVAVPASLDHSGGVAAALAQETASVQAAADRPVVRIDVVGAREG
jgi:hypothetical protein